MDALLTQLTGLIKEIQIPGEEEYILQIEQIRKRLNHPQMRLALIGNFSCGKSTFLNAMLKKPLLSMANMPTTAIPTYIDWCAPGDRIQIRVADQNNQHHLLDESGKKWLCEQTGTTLPASDGELLDFLTTTNALLDLLTGVYISFPGDSGYSGYSLIDTPGINPGDEEASGHILHTQDVLRDDADAAIVLFPSYCAYTRDFSEFLEQNAQHLLANSIFIVTKIDLVPTQKERDQLVQFVKSNLVRNFNLKDPQVYCCSAGCALDHYMGSASGSAQLAEDFEEMIREIFASLEPRRLHMASSRTFAMIMNLIQALRMEMERKQEELWKLLQNLEKYSYEELQKRYMSMYTDYVDKAQTAKMRTYRQTKCRVSAVVDEAVSILCRGIDQCGSKWAINSYVNNEAKAITDETTAELQKILEQTYGVMQKEQHYIYTEFSCDVEQLLYEFDFLMGSVQGVAKRLEKKSPVKQMSVDLNIQLTSAQNEIRSNLAMFTGGIVALSGAWILVLAGIILSSFVGLSSTKSRVTQEIKEKLCTVKKNANHQCNEIGDRMVSVHITAAEKLMLEYQKTYKELFERKKRKLEQYRQELEEELARNFRHIEQLEIIAEEMGKQSSRILSTIT